MACSQTCRASEVVDVLLAARTRDEDPDAVELVHDCLRHAHRAAPLERPEETAALVSQFWTSIPASQE